MNKAEKAFIELNTMEDLASGDSFFHRLKPLAKLVMIICYIAVVMSYDKYNISGLWVMILYPIVWYQLSLLPVSVCFKKLKYVMILVCLVGVANPILDMHMVGIGSLAIRGGWISLITLALKGIMALMASFLLMATTTIEGICSALRKLHIPKIITTQLMLTYRYVGVFLMEVAVMTDAYHLRAPKQKGIEASAWGSFLGQLILRSMDKAGQLYESMLLRGFDGEIEYKDNEQNEAVSVVSCVIFCGLIILTRIWNISELIGMMIGK